jgi:hypothetical protein
MPESKRLKSSRTISVKENKILIKHVRNLSLSVNLYRVLRYNTADKSVVLINDVLKSLRKSQLLVANFKLNNP